VAATVAAALAAYRGSRTLGLALAIPTVLLTVGVVYCQMHYGIDAVAGLAVGAAVAWSLRRVHSWELRPLPGTAPAEEPAALAREPR
jgi:membrane-associated phospholipid phosphatase